MAFQQRITEHFRIRRTGTPASGNRNASNIRRIILHHTAGHPSNDVEDLNPTGTQFYHFLVEPGTNVNGSAFQPNRFRGVALAHHWNFATSHAYRNNSDSIGIGVAGNYHTRVEPGDSVLPTNLFPAAMAEVRRNMAQIIADCLVSFPEIRNAQGQILRGIARVSQVGAPEPPEGGTENTASGIMRHADADPNGNRRFDPGVNLGVNDIIANAIAMANTFDAAERLRIEFQLPMQLPAVTWARDRRLIAVNGVVLDAGQFIVNLDRITISHGSSERFTTTTPQPALMHLIQRGLVPNSANWLNNNNFTRDVDLLRLVVEAANRVF